MWDMIDNFTKSHLDYKSNIKSKYERLNSEATYFESFIKDFFSQDKEKNQIREMYENIREDMLDTDRKVINVVDVSKSTSMYKEYLEGMISFINDGINIIKEGKEDAIHKFKDQLNKAENNDSIFIESIYGGNLNTAVESNLDDAVTNIECLIEFIDDNKSMINECTKIHDSINDIRSDEKGLLLESADMLYESINNFSYNTLNNIFKTYCSINDALSSETTPVVKQSSGYKLF